MEPETTVSSSTREENRVPSGMPRYKQGSADRKPERGEIERRKDTLREDDFFEADDASGSASEEESDAGSALESERS